MVAKIEVRKRIAAYEDKLRQEIKDVAKEMMRMKESCKTSDMEVVWKQSATYAKLHSRWETLHEILDDIIDLRCEETWED